MVMKAIYSLLIAAAPSLAEGAGFSNSVKPAVTDQYGCQVRTRPDHMTFTTFRDSWRSVAADKLYSLRRYQSALETGSCDCSVLQPEWSLIEGDYEILGFADGPSASYDEWSNEFYFPVISGLRDAVKEMCGEGR
ncbi:hypothetical protein K3552_05455 [Leisingera aquaemixtae]|nr:hypothetical protein K3552_05455 [Leisingera aquaemixtae]